MSAIDSLPPDQKAVLQLLLKQGKSYDQIAGMLRLDPANVRERALDALDALGADHEQAAEPLAPERQDELADHLLRQQSEAEHERTQTFLATSVPGRAGARAVAGDVLLLHDADHYSADGCWRRTVAALPWLLDDMGQRGLNATAV